MLRVLAIVAVVGMTLPLGGCYVGAGPGYGPGHGWCYWHPYRCR